MNGKAHRIPKSRALVIFTVIAALAAVAAQFAASGSVEPRRLYLQSSAGAVVFDHEAHAGYAEGCESCHHELLLSDKRAACSDCHDEGMSSEDFDHEELKTIEGHACERCHEVDKNIRANSCRGCHPTDEPVDLATVGCVECHDDDYTPDMMTHDELRDVEGHSCEGCHHARAIGAVFHGYCNHCHLTERPGIFADGNGGARCQSCHLK
jgi:hypothetical protein